MADPMPSQSSADALTSTITVVSSDTPDNVDAYDDVPRITLRLRKPKADKKVQWTTETVDNEEMNKKKSKCCCIYEKPRKFDESSSEEDSDDDECDHCHGHVEKKYIHHKHATPTDTTESAAPINDVSDISSPDAKTATLEQ